VPICKFADSRLCLSFRILLASRRVEIDFSKNFFAASDEPVNIASFASNLITALTSRLMANDPESNVPVFAATIPKPFGISNFTPASVAQLKIA